MKNITALFIAVLALAACVDDHKNYDATARCSSLGLKAGTKEYDKCVSEEATNQLMKQQREEYEQQKQWDRDWKLRRY